MTSLDAIPCGIDFVSKHMNEIVMQITRTPLACSSAYRRVSVAHK